MFLGGAGRAMTEVFRWSSRAALSVLLLAGSAHADLRSTIEDRAAACGYSSEDVEVVAAAADVYTAGGASQDEVTEILKANLDKCLAADQLAKILIMGAEDLPAVESPTAVAATRIEPELMTPSGPTIPPETARARFSSMLDKGGTEVDPVDHPSQDLRLTPESYADIDTRLPMVNPFPEFPDSLFHDLVLIAGFPVLLPDLPLVRLLPVAHQDILVPGELYLSGAIPTGTLAARIAIAQYHIVGGSMIGVTGNYIDLPELPLVELKNFLGFPVVVPEFPIWKALTPWPDIPFVKMVKIGLHDSPIGIRIPTPDLPFGDINVPLVNKRGSFHGIPILEPDLPFVSIDFPLVDEVANVGGVPLLAPTVPPVPPLLWPLVDKIGDFGGIPIYVPNLPLLPSDRFVAIAERLVRLF
jgi:hypothetical protein